VDFSPRLAGRRPRAEDTKLAYAGADRGSAIKSNSGWSRAAAESASLCKGHSSMPESPEHEFLKTRFNEVLRDFSSLKLYGFSETDRKRFDFSCLLERDWTRPVAGQVLWRHTEGIEKDVRTLLTDTQSEIKVYLASDTVSHHATFEETISDFRRSGRFTDLFRLKPIWVPSDFDADQEKQRLLIGEIVRSQIVEDILFNVVFGRINADNIRLLLGVSGIPGVNLAILHNIATEGFMNISTLAKRLDVSAGPIREKLALLEGTGFIASLKPGMLRYSESDKGKVFLDILSRLTVELPALSPELVYVLTKLGCKPVDSPEDWAAEVFPTNTYIALIRTMEYAARRWGINFKAIDRSKKIDLPFPDELRRL
jgi:hypothetical protein